MRTDWSVFEKPNDIEQLRQRIDAEEKHARIIAKIEKPEAVECWMKSSK